MGRNKDTVLCIGDLHLPFEHKDYLDFCREMQDRLHAGTIMFMGDIVDLHSDAYTIIYVRLTGSKSIYLFHEWIKNTIQDY